MMIDDLREAPFVDGGRDLATGLDCWGLLMEVMKRFGHCDVPDFRMSCFDSDGVCRMFRSETGNGFVWRRCEDGPAPARVVTLCMDPARPGMVQHYGVCLDRWRFIHTMQKTGVLVTKLNHRFFVDKIEGYYEWIGK